MSPAQQSPAPSLFISHGAGPFPLLEPSWEFYRQAISKHGSLLDGVKGILLFSAHWETEEPHITACDDPAIYYDYADMESVRDLIPNEAYKLEYPVAGDAKLAVQVANRLREFDFKPVLDHKRGLDHAVFVPMTILRPHADVPIVQMSVLKGKDEHDSAEKNLKLGQAVECFRRAGYAIVGSGGSYHDFKTGLAAYMKNEPLPSGSEEFEKFLYSTASIVDPVEREKVLRNWRQLPASYVAHVAGESEHFMPFLVAAGGGGNKAGERINFLQGPGGPMSMYMW